MLQVVWPWNMVELGANHAVYSVELLKCLTEVADASVFSPLMSLVPRDVSGGFRGFTGKAWLLGALNLHSSQR